MLCRLDSLADGETRGFAFGSGLDLYEIFLMRRGEEVLAYVNACPHIGTPLDTVPDRFLTQDRRHFLCSTHGALFRLEDGFCVAGPCRGESLIRAPVRVVDGLVLLAEGGARRRA